MAPPARARVDNSATVRSASKNKQRAPTNGNSSSSSKRSASSAANDPLGGAGGGSLASSLSSLLSPGLASSANKSLDAKGKGKGKDAALASLLGLGAGSKPNPPPLPHNGSKGGAAQLGLQSLQSLSATSQPTNRKKQKLDPTAASSSTLTLDRPTPSPDLKARHSTHAIPPTPTPPTPAIPPGRKPVYRPVLASATTVSWPDMPVAGSNTVLHTLLDILSDPAVRESVQGDLGRRTRTRPDRQEGKTSNCVPTTATTARTTETTTTAMEQLCTDSQREPPQPGLVAGINGVTRRLELEIRDRLASLPPPHHSTDQRHECNESLLLNNATRKPGSTRIVFVCRHDLQPASLIAHFPMLVSACNAVLQGGKGEGEGEGEKDTLVYLFPLPLGAEAKLASMLGLAKCSVVAITSAFPPRQLARLVAAVHRETARRCQLLPPWLAASLRSALSYSQSELGIQLEMEPTTVKFVRSTQPVDLNACRLAKKSRRTLRSSRWKKRKLQALHSLQSLQAQIKAAKR
ncbi:hypothetical protein BCV70DRAFT_148508, partial [Testicularia cyperi]